MNREQAKAIMENIDLIKHFAEQLETAMLRAFNWLSSDANDAVRRGNAIRSLIDQPVRGK